MLRCSIAAFILLLAGEGFSQTCIPALGPPNDVCLVGRSAPLGSAPQRIQSGVQGSLNLFHIEEGGSLEWVPGSSWLDQRDSDEVVHAASHAGPSSVLLLLGFSKLLAHDAGAHRRRHTVVETSSAFQELHDLLVDEDQSNVTAADQLESYDMEELTGDREKTSRSHFLGLDRILHFGKDDKYVRSGQRRTKKPLNKEPDAISYREEAFGGSHHYFGRVMEMVVPGSLVLILFSAVLLLPTFKSINPSAS